MGAEERRVDGGARVGARLGVVGLALLVAVPLHAAPPRKKGAPPAGQAEATIRLVHTREILEHVRDSFVGEPTYAELLMGGLGALARLCPGAAVQMKGDTTVTFELGGKVQVYETAGMVVMSQLGAALEKAVRASRPSAPLAVVDDAVAAGVVSGTMDRHSAYLRPMFMERLGYSSGEKLGDPGLEPGFSGARMVVRSVSPGSSAALSGVRPLMLLRRVDDVNVDGLSLGEVSALLYGPAGSNVSVVLEPRGDNAAPLTVALHRDPPFALEPHMAMVNDALHVVPGPLLGNASKVVRGYLQSVNVPVRGIILDFRGNGGGRVGDAAELADLFIADGQLCSVVSRPGRPMQRFAAHAGDPGEKLPVVVLVDGRSASAVELVSLVLRERRNTRVLGSQTFGKGSVQTLIRMDGGGYLKITAAMYMTPAGTTVGEGLVPDVVLSEADYPPRGKEGDLQTDGWLKAAYEALVNPPPEGTNANAAGQHQEP